ncbi:unnamed protein product [Blepharisma stoltei]|uniref:Uncharacterized protein n=1 Tax=Blepharisma stoltei TaxID=1481888 RepID=A0AAU9IQV7_9CILI|nr:unnamed protein product [Blepharisma stoltei]
MSKRVQNELTPSIEQGNFERVCNLLTKANIEEKNHIGCTPLAVATRSGHLKIVELLIKEGANINAVNDAGQSILFIACWHNHKDVVELLINQGAIVDQPDQRGWTPLIISVYHDYTEIVELLLQAGADIEHQDSFGKKAIDRAKNVEIISLLRKYSESEKFDKKVPLSLPGTPYSISTLQDLLRPKSRDSLINREYEHPQKPLNSSSLEARQPTPLKQKSTRFEIPENPVDILENDEKGFLDMDYKINEQLNQAIDVLQQEIEALVNRSSRELFINLKEYVFKTVENLLSSRNYKISTSKIQVDFSENFEFKDQLVNISTYRSQYSEEPWYSSNNQDKRIDAIKEDLYRNVNKHIGELDNKVNELSGNHISLEVKNRIFAVKNAINSELSQYLLYLSGRVKNILEEIASERIKEICEDNKAAFPTYGNKINKSSTSSVEDYEIAESLKIPKHRWSGHKEKSESQGFSSGFLSNFSQDFTKYKNPQMSSAFQNDELSQSYSKETLRAITPVNWSKYSNGDSKHAPPSTNIASALQGFLNFEEKFGK